MNMNNFSKVASVLNGMGGFLFVTVSLFLLVGSVMLLVQLASVSSLLLGSGVLMASLGMLLWMAKTTVDRFFLYSAYKEDPADPSIVRQSETPFVPLEDKKAIAFWMWLILSCGLIGTALVLGASSSLHSIWMVQVLESMFGASSVNPLLALLTLAIGTTCVYYLLMIKTSLLYEDRKIATDGVKQHPIAFVLKQLGQAVFIALSIGYGIYGVLGCLAGAVSAATVGLLLAYLSIALAGVAFLLYSLHADGHKDRDESLTIGSYGIMVLACVCAMVSFMSASLFTASMSIMLAMTLVMIVGWAVAVRQDIKRFKYALIQNETDYEPLLPSVAAALSSWKGYKKVLLLSSGEQEVPSGAQVKMNKDQANNDALCYMYNGDSFLIVDQKLNVDAVTGRVTFKVACVDDSEQAFFVSSFNQLSIAQDENNDSVFFDVNLQDISSYIIHHNVFFSQIVHT